ncbi:putative pterin-4-alpha-carbinolamine dehydratase [Panicum miliaceum]|uniref:4a-hydroxytetrahydrobiopterin dehydratase n=1 Tax=Panicum miliaceum TaxID=4540 RepID=A0A3L6R2Z3_PANMI|nr:putative pterin-4-alpha-carbinolamine dehydratase [Panicum miliaceum]
MIRAATVQARLLLPRSYASQVSMGKIDPPPWEHIIEHLRPAADVPLSVGRAGKGGVPLASRLREAFASWVWAMKVYGLFRSYVSSSLTNGIVSCPTPFHQMDTRGQDENKVLTARGCHTSPESQELADKSCVPCSSKDLHPMSEDSAKKLLEQVNGWELTTEGGILKLHRAWKVKNFLKGLEFFQLVAAIAEAEGHHPDLHLVGWNNVKIDVWTHSVRGLTDNDFILAAKINHLNLEGILSKRANVQK